jgi:hypothetical protein
MPAPPFERSPQPSINRRHFCGQVGTGIGSVALTWLLQQEAARAGVSAAVPAKTNQLLRANQGHFPARAKSCIFLTMTGGPSHIDTFDPKPELQARSGQLFKREGEKFQSNQNKGERYLVGSMFDFKKYGQCGMDVSELFKETAACVDDMAFVRSVYAESDNHPAALLQFLTGMPRQGNPSIGAWTVYGLGADNDNLPAFVVLRDGRPFGGTATWGNAYLPSYCQGTQFRSGDHPVLNLTAPKGVGTRRQRRGLDLLKEFNQMHLGNHPLHPELEARIANYELAYRMQTEVPEAVSVESEPEAIRNSYGLDQEVTQPFGRRCLLARRLVERGVRFVQVWADGWDSHDDIAVNHRDVAAKVDRPIAGLLKDLKQRGLLEDTLVVWGGEFGRTSDTNAGNHKKNKPGRDHNPHAMTMWFAGGGIRGGTLIGSTDEIGHKAAESPYHLRDVHATLLHLFGLDQFELNFLHGGRFKQLTDTGGKIIEGILA